MVGYVYYVDVCGLDVIGYLIVLIKGLSILGLWLFVYFFVCELLMFFFGVVWVLGLVWMFMVGIFVFGEFLMLI